MALNSVNTNTAAIVALQSLNRTNAELLGVQKRVSTGFRISDAKEDGAAFSIAQGLRGDLKGYEAIKEQLSKAKGTMAVANDVARSISDTLASVRAVIVKLADDNTTGSQRTQYEGDYAALKTEIANFIANASFNGANLLNTTTDLNVISTLTGTSMTLNAFALGTDVSNNLTAATSATLARALLTATGGLSVATGNIGTAMSSLGADTRALDNQITFIGVLRDATEEGVGAIVDADLAKESARLQSLQVRQQLGTQTLNIANQSPNILLSLFGN
jgi:flagellin